MRPRGFLSLLLTSLLLLSGPALADIESYQEQWRWSRFAYDSGLPSNRITSIAETADGTTWVSTPGGLAWYDGFQWHAIRTATNGEPFVKVKSLTAKGGTLIVQTDSAIFTGDAAGFSRVNIPRDVTGLPTMPVAGVPFGDGLLLQFHGRLCSLQGGSLTTVQTPGNIFNDGGPQIWSTPAGQTWTNTDSGVFCRRDDRWVKVLNPGEVPLGIKALVQQDIRHAYVWIFRATEMIGLWELSGGGLLERSPTEGADFLRTADVARDGTVMALYESGDVRIFSRGSWSTLSPVPAPLQDARVLLFRSNGDLWVGTDNGLFLHSTSNGRWTTIRHPFPSLKNSVTDIVKAHDGALWMATKFGLDIRRPNGIVTTIDTILGTPLNTLTAVAEDRDGNMWVSSGSAFRGAFRWDGLSWKWFGPGEGLTAFAVHRICRDRNGDLWFLSLANLADPSTKEAGVFRLHDGLFTQVSTRDGLINNRVYAFAQGPDSAYWFGTYGGLSRLHRGVWRHWTTKQHLINDRIFTLTIDHKNRLWFSDQTNGIGFLDGDDQPHYYTTADGLINDKVWEVVCDDEGALWISSEGGLSMFRNGVFSTFGTNAGLSTPALWPVLALEDSIYLGTVGRGLTVLSRGEEHAPDPLVELVPPVVEEESAFLRWRAFAYWEQIPTLQVEARYRLDDEQWSRWSTDRERTYTGLRPGAHTLQVQAKGLFGNFDPKGSSVRFTIAAPFYARMQFIVPIAFLAALLLAFGVWYLVRKRQQDRILRESEEKYRTLMEQASDGIIITDGHGRILETNSMVTRILGFSAPELKQLTLADLVPMDDHGELPFLKGDTRPGGQVLVEHRLTTKGGEVVQVEVSATRLEDGRRQAIIRDITERKRLESELENDRALLAQRVEERTRELIQVNAELERASRLKDEFLAGMSHELRTPLNSVLGLSTSLQEGVYGDVSERQASILRTIQESGRHLLRLVNDLLDLTKIQSGKADLQIDTVHVRSVCESSVAMVRSEAQKKNIRVEYRVCDRPSAIQADERRLKQILVNLLDNAVKFTFPGGAIGLDVMTNSGGGEMRFVIWDTGIGIAEADIHKLFQPFAQLEQGYARQHAGTGLGLALVKRMAEMHKGRVAVESEPGKGSRFIVTIPIHGAAPAREPERADPAVPLRTASSDARILVVEDNTANLMLVTDLLQSRGYTVAAVCNAQEALDHIDHTPPEVVLMDIQMPGMDGFEAIRRIRENPATAHIRVVALSALAMASDRERCLQAGANDHVSKPIEFPILIDAIEHQIEIQRNGKGK